jgi:hypothetical protein
MVGLPRVMIAYADIVLASGNTTLVDAVLAKTMTLRQAFLAVRQGIKLVETYGESSAANKIFFGRTIGPEVIFDEVVDPALVPVIDPVITPTAVVTIKTPAGTAMPTNGKATNGTGNGSHSYVRPAARVVDLNSSTTH